MTNNFTNFCLLHTLCELIMAISSKHEYQQVQVFAISNTRKSKLKLSLVSSQKDLGWVSEELCMLSLDWVHKLPKKYLELNVVFCGSFHNLSCLKKKMHVLFIYGKR